MASYRKFGNKEKVFVEQNIFNNIELESYQAKMDMLGKTKNAVLYYYEDSYKDRFYLLGLIENINKNQENIKIVCDDLTNIFKYKTAQTRRKHIYELIRLSEKSIMQ